MNCSEIKDILPAYQEHDLEEELFGRVKTHLDSCPSCREEERLLTASWEALDVLTLMTPSPRFRERLWARIEKEKARRKGFQGFPIFQPQGMRIPVLTSVAGFLFAWVVGMTSGITVYKFQTVRTPTVIEASVGIFTEPYPSGSIESTFLQTADFMGR